MKRILIVLVMIAGSVFIATPTFADDVVPSDTGTTSAPTDPAPAADPAPEPEPAPAPAAAPADEAPAPDPAPAANAPDPVGSTDSSTDPAPKRKTASRFLTSAKDDVVAADEILSWCHATGSESNPYLEPETGDSGQAHGHIGHTGPTWYQGAKADGVSWGDIIPPFTYLGVVYSLNWDAAGQIIFNNNCAPPVVTATAPSAIPPTCVADGSLVIPSVTGVIYTSLPAGTGPGTYAITAAAAPGYQLTGTKAWSVTVLPQLTQSAACPVTVTPTAPSATPPTCTAGGTLVIPTQTGVSFNSTPAGTGPGTYHVVATAANNTWVLSGTTVWDITVDPTLPQSAQCPVTITPTAPSANPPTCDAGGTLVIPTQTGVSYNQANGAGPGQYHVIASPADASWLLSGTTVWDITVDPKLPQSAQCPVTITPTAPSANPPTCDAGGTLVIPTQTGVSYDQVNGAGPGQYHVIATAADNTWVLTGTTVWDITVLPKLPQSSDCPVAITPNAPSANAPTCVADGSLFIPTQTGVTYSEVNGSGPGQYHVVASAADNSWVLSGTTEWDITVLPKLAQSADCPVTITPDPPSAVAPTCVADGSLTIPTQTGVTYSELDGDGPGQYHVVATAANNTWVLSGTTEWDVTVLPKLPQSADCPVTITPDPPSAVAPTCDADGSLSIPTQEGVIYSTEPTYTIPGDYVVTAAPADDSWVLTGTKSWPITVLPTLPQSAQCPVTITADPPSANEPTCVADGSLFIPTETGVTYLQDPTGSGPGSYHITAVPADASWVLSGTAEWDVTVAPRLPQSIACPAPAITPDGLVVTVNCAGGDVPVIPTTEGVEYTFVVGDGISGPWEIDATALPGWTLEGQTVFTGDAGDPSNCPTEPDGTPVEPDAALPDTGGSALGLIPLGVTLVVAGAMVLARKRNEA